MVVEYCKKMKGFQMHLFAHGAPTPVFFFIMCSKVVCILQYLFSLLTYLCMHTQYVRTCLCPLSCAIGIFTCVQLANTIVALASLCWNFYLSVNPIVSCRCCV